MEALVLMTWTGPSTGLPSGDRPRFFSLLSVIASAMPGVAEFDIKPAEMTLILDEACRSCSPPQRDLFYAIGIDVWTEGVVMLDARVRHEIVE